MERRKHKVDSDGFVVYGLIGEEYFRVDVLHSIPGTDLVFVRVCEGAYNGMQGRIKASRLIMQDGLFENGPKRGEVGKCG